jgi:predicted Co/Zn/Cd cation transporter (cation efflux family)
LRSGSSAHQADLVLALLAAFGIRWHLAHQYGWDEIVLFAVPIVLALLAIRWAERRSKRNKE